MRFNHSFLFNPFVQMTEQSFMYCKLLYLNQVSAALTEGTSQTRGYIRYNYLISPVCCFFVFVFFATGTSVAVSASCSHCPSDESWNHTETTGAEVWSGGKHQQLS